MSEYSDLQVALINARDTYEECRNDFPDPKDRRIHKRQCDLISNHIRDLPQLTTTQSEIEALQTLLGAALCPCCDGSGAHYDNYGEVCRCQWCDQRAQRLRQQADEAERAGGEK